MFRKCVLFIILSVVTGPAFAERSGDQGYGLMIGNPTAASAKFWLNETWAIDGAVGIARSEFDIHATLLRHHFSWHDRIGNKWQWFQDLLGNGDLPFYWGVGPRYLFEEDEELGIRFPVGLSFFPNDSNWEFFTEVAPVLRLTPNTGFNGDYSLGVRYYFKSIRPITANGQN